MIMILYRHLLIFFSLSILINACDPFTQQRTASSPDTSILAFADTVKSFDSITAKDNIVQVSNVQTDSVIMPSSQTINTANVKPAEIVKFAKSLIGVPYRFGSVNPKVGFDCSGFITYVFNHFNISVPRSSVDFTNVGKAVPVELAKSGDIILFTGTDSTEGYVGHMGIVVSNDNDELQFIHSTSGKAYGVTISPLSVYYKSRFIKTIRVFKENDL